MDPIEKLRDALQCGRVTINALDDGSGVLLDVDGEQLISLNRTGIRLVQYLDEGAATLDAVRDRLAEEFEIDSDRAERDARAFFAELARAV
ncbi:MAG: PqqD family protein [Wenzhouxiangellaceae bacterium]